MSGGRKGYISTYFVRFCAFLWLSCWLPSLIGNEIEVLIETNKCAHENVLILMFGQMQHFILVYQANLFYALGVSFKQFFCSVSRLRYRSRCVCCVPDVSLRKLVLTAASNYSSYFVLLKLFGRVMKRHTVLYPGFTWVHDCLFITVALKEEKLQLKLK